MKSNLSDVTFIVPVRIDTIYRLENLLTITNMIVDKFDTNIYVREAANNNSNILQRLLHKSIQYEFVEDKDPVFFRTQHINQMVSQVKTPYIAIWDADIVIDKHAVEACMEKLRSNECAIAFPYNGICYDVPAIIKTLFFKRRDVRLLLRHKEKMSFLYDRNLVGGALFVNRTSYIDAGMENENIYGWGNDDWDRYVRLTGLGYSVYRYAKPLFHLSHPRGSNSTYRSSIASNISTAEYIKNKNSSESELREQISGCEIL